jgi:ComF family protein
MDLLLELRRGLTEVADRALDMALPPMCAGCGVEGPVLCAGCAPALDVRLASAPGVPIGLPADIPAPLVQLEWCTSFTGVARRAIHRLKYDGERRLAAPLGSAMARRWRRAGVGAEVVVPVPASPDRVRDRGYDQAGLLARVMARELHLPMAAPVVRARSTTAQFDLDRTARGSNVRGAFRLAGADRAEGADVGAQVRGRWIVLVDDVATTGSTLGECGRVLMEAGAFAVAGMTLARER